MRGLEETTQLLGELGDRFDRIAVACSFQKEAVVIAHLVSEQLPNATFFTLDTGLFFGETYETWEQLEERLGITVEGRRTAAHDGEQAVLFRVLGADGRPVLRDGRLTIGAPRAGEETSG